MALVQRASADARDCVLVHVTNMDEEVVAFFFAPRDELRPRDHELLQRSSTHIMAAPMTPDELRVARERSVAIVTLVRKLERDHGRLRNGTFERPISALYAIRVLT